MDWDEVHRELEVKMDVALRCCEQHQTVEQKLILCESCLSSGRPTSCLMAVRQREMDQEEMACRALRHLDIIHVYRK